VKVPISDGFQRCLDSSTLTSYGMSKRSLISRYAQLLLEAKSTIRQINLTTLREKLQSQTPPIVIDVREVDEWMRGHIPGAHHIPASTMAQKIDSIVPDRSSPVVTFCGRGARAAFAALELQNLGYNNVVAADPGFLEWRALGLPVETPNLFSGAQVDRYARHLRLSEIGAEGQKRLMKARALVVGAGGLGAPALQYLAAAGLGTIGIMDDDDVAISNLQRQVIHGERHLGVPKVESAKAFIANLNSDVAVESLPERLSAENVDAVLNRGWDVILDGMDNFEGRYILNDAAAQRGIPLVHGAVHRFDGQITTLHPPHGPCYRCFHPSPPPAGLSPSCEEAGVLGVLPGVIGLLQATEALKVLLGIGNTLVGRVLHYDALNMQFRSIALARQESCPGCQHAPTAPAHR